MALVTAKLAEPGILNGANMAKMIDFRIDYIDQLVPMLVPKFRQLGRQWRYLGAQDPPWYT